MPLDAWSQELLRQRALNPVLPVAQQDLAEVRASRKRWRGQTITGTVAVGRVRDVVITADDGFLSTSFPAPALVPVRVYEREPEPAVSARGAVVFFHGGGWVIGDLDHSDLFCRWLCRETGLVVFNVDYRLAPEHPYPRPLLDCVAVLRALAAEPGRFGIDPDRVAVMGASAGGNLAAASTLALLRGGGWRPAAVVLAYPVLDDACDSPSYQDFSKGYFVSSADMAWYWQQYLGAAAADDLTCPLRAPDADLARFPPTLVVTAEYDPVRDDGERFAARLTAAGASAVARRWEGTLHMFLGTPDANPASRAASRQVADFLTARLRETGPGTPSPGRAVA
jgi:acetyl esterase